MVYRRPMPDIKKETQGEARKTRDRSHRSRHKSYDRLLDRIGERSIECIKSSQQFRDNVKLPCIASVHRAAHPLLGRSTVRKWTILSLYKRGSVQNDVGLGFQSEVRLLSGFHIKDISPYSRGYGLWIDRGPMIPRPVIT